MSFLPFGDDVIDLTKDEREDSQEPFDVNSFEFQWLQDLEPLPEFDLNCLTPYNSDLSHTFCLDSHSDFGQSTQLPVEPSHDYAYCFDHVAPPYTEQANLLDDARLMTINEQSTRRSQPSNTLHPSVPEQGFETMPIFFGQDSQMDIPFTFSVEYTPPISTIPPPSIEHDARADLFDDPPYRADSTSHPILSGIQVPQFLPMSTLSSYPSAEIGSGSQAADSTSGLAVIAAPSQDLTLTWTPPITLDDVTNSNHHSSTSRGSTRPRRDDIGECSTKPRKKRKVQQSADSENMSPAVPLQVSFSATPTQSVPWPWLPILQCNVAGSSCVHTCSSVSMMVAHLGKEHIVPTTNKTVTTLTQDGTRVAARTTCLWSGCGEDLSVCSVARHTRRKHLKELRSQCGYCEMTIEEPRRQRHEEGACKGRRV